MSKSSDAKIKLLTKDRKTFLKFCMYANVEDCQLAFEAAAAKDVAVDLDELIANSRHIGDTVKASKSCERKGCSSV